MSWDAIAAISTAFGSLIAALVLYNEVRKSSKEHIEARGKLFGQFEALRTDVQRHGTEINGLREDHKDFATVTEVATVESRLTQLLVVTQTKIDAGFLALSNRLDQVLLNNHARNKD